MRRIMGSDRRERVLEERYRPYSYQSNATSLRYVGVALLVWVALSLGLAWNDRSNVNLYREWDAEGLTMIPPTGISPDDLIAYAQAEGFACNSVEQLSLLTPECLRVLEIRRDFVGSQDTSNLLFAGLVIWLVLTAFPFSTFTNRASRNLLTLKSAGQKFSPEWAVLWFFIPVMNAVRPVQVFRELLRGSDPGVSTEDARDWQKRGRTPVILYLWWPLFVVSLFFNPVIVPRIWAGDRLNIADLVRTSNMLYWSDLLLAFTGVMAFLMLWQLHSLQEARHAKVGDIVVTRPMPGDPFAGSMSGGQSKRGSSEGDNR